MNAPGPIPPIDNRRFVADSAHHLTGRKGHAIKLLALHATEGEASGPWLSTQSPEGQSCHHLYARDGTRYDLVKRIDTAYHAGISAWGPYSGSVGGVSIVNLVSIGHELESTTTGTRIGNGYTAPQLATLAYTLAGELYSYGLDWGAIVTHAQIAPGRKTDPAHLDLAALRGPVGAWLAFWHSLNPADVARWIV